MTGQRSFSGTEARQLLRRARTAALASRNGEDGMPYASLVNVATSVEGHPVILVSALAWHTRNLLADARASVMVAEVPGTGDALTGPRATVMGRFGKVDDPSLRRRYLARHPQAATYAAFGDFAFWRMIPDRIHAVAGFGRIETMEVHEVFPSVSEMVELEESAIAHMNMDHADAVERYAVKLLGGTPGPWKITAIDTDGADLALEDRVLRLSFGTPVTTGDSLRQRLARLGRENMNDG